MLTDNQTNLLEKGKSFPTRGQRIVEAYQKKRELDPTLPAKLTFFLVEDNQDTLNLFRGFFKGTDTMTPIFPEGTVQVLESRDTESIQPYIGGIRSGRIKPPMAFLTDMILEVKAVGEWHHIEAHLENGVDVIRYIRNCLGNETPAILYTANPLELVKEEIGDDVPENFYMFGKGSGYMEVIDTILSISEVNLGIKDSMEAVA